MLMTTQEPLLKIDNVRAVYNLGIIALRGVTISVKVGEIVALLGANGAGKTTTLMASSNILPAVRGKVVSGDILFDGASIHKRTSADLVEMGLVQVGLKDLCRNRITGGSSNHRLPPRAPP